MLASHHISEHRALAARHGDISECRTLESAGEGRTHGKAKALTTSVAPEESDSEKK